MTWSKGSTICSYLYVITITLQPYKMKKILLLPIVSILFFDSSFAQSVGINNDGSAPHPSSMLDVKHPKGLLVPRVILTGTGDITTITSPATSLLVYNTATNGAGVATVTRGYYYWSGSEWLRIGTSAGSSNSWLLTGNAGTVDGTNSLALLIIYLLMLE